MMSKGRGGEKGRAEPLSKSEGEKGKTTDD